jgi:hypothetical protein
VKGWTLGVVGLVVGGWWGVGGVVGVWGGGLGGGVGEPPGPSAKGSQMVFMGATP